MRQIDAETKAKRNKQYNDWARKRPAYIFLAISISIAVAMGISNYVTSKEWGKALFYLGSISAISTALFFLVRLALRDISRIYPEKIIFCNRLKPTNRLLYSTDVTYTDERKKEILRKIKSKKNIDLEKFKTKTYKNKNYVKRVDEAVAWLCDVTRFDDILFEYNCFYGFWRNLTAAFLVDSLFVLCLAVVNKWLYPLPFGDALVWMALVIILLSVLTAIAAYKNGRIYADKVYSVFLNLDEDKDNY